MAAEERGVPGVALVTGAASGIGLEVARQLAGRGMTVVSGAGCREEGEHLVRFAGEGAEAFEVRFE